MPVRLDEEQWARIFAMSSSSKEGTEAGGGRPPLPKSNEVVYVLALEGDKPDAKWRWWERLLDTVVQTVQPAPALTHIELIIPALKHKDDVHFGTYLGKRANWGSGFGDSVSYYLDPDGNGPAWRAVPVVAHGAISRLRAECEQHVGTPYGDAHRLFNYPFAVPPLRSLAWTLDDAPLANGHCATLVARCLKRALPELGLEQASGWYGPSTLFLELSRRARMVSYHERMAEMATTKSLPETEEATHAAETLLRGSDEAVRGLDDGACRAGVDLLCVKCLSAAAGDDVTAERLTQKQLARALLRASLISRSARLRALTASTATPEQAASAPTLEASARGADAEIAGPTTAVPTLDGSMRMGERRGLDVGTSRYD